MNETLKEQLMKYKHINNLISINENMNVTRGDVFWADFGEPRGHIQGGIRPAVIISNEKCNKKSPVLTVAPVTTSKTKSELPTHVVMDYVLFKTSMVLCEGTTTLNKSDLQDKIGHCNEIQMIDIDRAVAVQMDLVKYFSTEEKFNKEVFDIYKVQKIVKNLNELDIFIKKFGNPMIQTIKDSRETLLLELQDYCNKFNKNVNLFYKGVEKTNNKIEKYIRKVAINNTNKKREVLAIG